MDTPNGIATRPHIPDILPTIQAKHISRHHSFDYARVGASKHDMTSMSKEGSSEKDNNIGGNVVGGRIFSWKIMSYTQCSRSCGGGFQVIFLELVFKDSFEDEMLYTSGIYKPIEFRLGGEIPLRRRRC